MPEEVGGFFASLKLMTDDSSFQRGMSSIGGLVGGLGKIIGMAGPLAAIAGVIKKIIDLGGAEGQKLVTGELMGMSADQLTMWSGAMAEAGGNADAMISSVQKLHTHLVGVTTAGRGADETFKNLAILLGDVDFDKWLKMPVNDQVKSIVSAAAKPRAGLNQQQAYYLLGEILPEAKQLVGYSHQTGRSVEQILKESLERIYVSDRSRREALTGKGQVGALGDALGNLMSASAAKSFENAAAGMKDLVAQVQGAQGAFKALSDLLGAVGAGFLNFGVLIADLILGPLIAIGDLLSGHPAKAAEDLMKSLNTLIDSLSLRGAVNGVEGWVKGGAKIPLIPGIPTDQQIIKVLVDLSADAKKLLSAKPSGAGLSTGLDVAGQASGR